MKPNTITNDLPLVILTHSLPYDWIQILNGHCEIISGPADSTNFDPLLLEYLPKAEGILSLLTMPITKDVLEHAKQLKVVSNMAVGVDNIDIVSCTKRRIPVGNTPGVLTESTADLTMALILSSARNISSASHDAREGLWKTWSPDGWLGLELCGSTLGIIGMGKIGQAVAHRAAGFGLKILFYDIRSIHYPGAIQLPLEDLLKYSDIISLHIPLTVNTRYLIDKTTFSLIKPTAILINTARGPIINTEALIDALKSGRISSVALDVTDPEPLPPTHPLYKFPNCLIVPHIGSATHITRRRMAELACANLLAGLKGERLPYCVNPEVYNQ